MILVSDTQLRIIDAFFLLAEKSDCAHKITMQQIAEKAGITRQNIYKNHFHGVDDIIRTVHLMIDSDCKNLMKKFVSNNSENLSTFLADEILPILYSRRAWLKNLYDTSLDPDWLPFLHEQYKPLVKLYLRNDIDKICSKLEISPDFVCDLIIGNTLVIISCWITSNIPEPPTLFKYKFLNLFSLTLDSILYS
uniref:Putative transcriptional regulator n=1 Tax=Lactococcus lactis TaxID=1358 RepID=L0N6Y0_9LACT|nr:putative transcriptional regulator [Lactococcus lactis]